MFASKFFRLASPDASSRGITFAALLRLAVLLLSTVEGCSVARGQYPGIGLINPAQGPITGGTVVTVTSVGAFALIAGSKDAALVAPLAPGNYTAQISGANDTGGLAIVEVYEVP